MFQTKVQAKYNVEAGPVIDINTGKELKKGALPSSKAPSKKDENKQIKELAKLLQNKFHLDVRAELDEDVLDMEMFHINTPAMTEEEYDEMEREMGDAEIQTKTYSVYAWNDVSGYEYWHKEGEHNYIQITARIKNFAALDPKKLAADMNKVYNSLKHWETDF